MISYWVDSTEKTNFPKLNSNISTDVCIIGGGITGIATAYMDSIPMVAITCNVPNNLLGKDTFQEIDITGVTMPITKHNFMVRDVKDLAKTIREAFEIARSGRPGPVLVDILKDVTAAEIEFEPLPKSDNNSEFIIETHKNLKRVMNVSEPTDEE